MKALLIKLGDRVGWLTDIASAWKGLDGYYSIMLDSGREVKLTDDVSATNHIVNRDEVPEDVANRAPTFTYSEVLEALV